MKKLRYALLLLVAIFTLMPVSAQSESTKKERNLISKGNKLYREGNFRQAMDDYSKALKENPSSAVGKFNLALSQIKLGTNQKDTSEQAKKFLAEGEKNMSEIARMDKQKPDLASLANYNLGNIAFNSEDYAKAIEYYKQSLRLNPNDDKARKNLRLAQLKKQEQDQNKNDDNKENEDNKDKDKEKDQNKDKDKDKENQDKNNNEDKQDKQDQQNQQNKPDAQDLNRQTAEQILNAMENKENQTRARLGNQSDKSSGARGYNRKRW